MDLPLKKTYSILSTGIISWVVSTHKEDLVCHIGSFIAKDLGQPLNHPSLRSHHPINPYNLIGICRGGEGFVIQGLFHYIPKSCQGTASHLAKFCHLGSEISPSFVSHLPSVESSLLPFSFLRWLSFAAP